MQAYGSDVTCATILLKDVSLQKIPRNIFMQVEGILRYVCDLCDYSVAWDHTLKVHRKSEGVLLLQKENLILSQNEKTLKHTKKNTLFNAYLSLFSQEIKLINELIKMLYFFLVSLFSILFQSFPLIFIIMIFPVSLKNFAIDIFLKNMCKIDTCLQSNNHFSIVKLKYFF